jgi:uncharacterized protein YegP (UPF0339 family)
MYGGPDETERESLELERIRSEIAVKRADAIRNLAQAETAHSPIQMRGLNDEQFFEIYRDARCHWHWMLISENGRITATSGEGYKDEATCRRSISFLKAARFAQVVKR